jgi:hypothetical protein
MAPEAVSRALNDIAASPDFVSRAGELADQWRHSGYTLETVSAILRFMEDHPDIDFGAPGPLVHFVEEFYGKGYEAILLESIERRPTAHTAWMLNRLLNGTSDPSARQALLHTFRRARDNPSADQEAIEAIESFLNG